MYGSIFIIFLAMKLRKKAASSKIEIDEESFRVQFISSEIGMQLSII
jgi:hypothetical protein